MLYQAPMHGTLGASGTESACALAVARISGKGIVTWFRVCVTHFPYLICIPTSMVHGNARSHCLREHVVALWPDRLGHLHP